MNHAKSKPYAQPYLDVNTLRNGDSFSRGPTSLPHKLLLREPVTVPYMAHIEVNSPDKLRDACLFYPTGQKNLTMSRTISNSLRQSSNFSVERFCKAHPIKKRKSPKKEAVPHPREPLYFGRSNRLANEEDVIKSVVSRSRDVEARLVRTIQENHNAAINGAGGEVFDDDDDYIPYGAESADNTARLSTDH
jgi:hypothetical protein